MQKIRTFTYSLSLLGCLGVVLGGSSISAATPVMGGDSSTTTMVIQTDAATGLKYYIYSASDTGVSASPFPIGVSGATFDLWLKGTPPDTAIYLADSETVGAYKPTGTFVINSEDPWVSGSPASPPYIKRTRADKGYSYTLSVANLMAPGAGVPLSAHSVRLDHNGVNYYLRNDWISPPSTDLQRGPYTGIDVPDLIAPEFAIGSALNITANGNVTQNFAYHNLPLAAGADATKACGEEQLILYQYPILNPDNSVAMAAAPIAKATIVVYPAGSAQITGITEGQVVNAAFPFTSLTYQDMYPDSLTYCQIYNGPQVLGTVGTVVVGSERALGSFAVPAQPSADVPQNAQIAINLAVLCPTNGQYTLEVITKTPFNGGAAERLSYVTFTVNIAAPVVVVPGVPVPDPIASSIRGQITTGN